MISVIPEYLLSLLYRDRLRVAANLTMREQVPRQTGGSDPGLRLVISNHRRSPSATGVANLPLHRRTLFRCYHRARRRNGLISVGPYLQGIGFLLSQPDIAVVNQNRCGPRQHIVRVQVADSEVVDGG
ncbi:hypothetical protein GA0115259_105041, partial [Streptomyces sp. MnatMP-M17]